MKKYISLVLITAMILFLAVSAVAQAPYVTDTRNLACPNLNLPITNTKFTGVSNPTSWEWYYTLKPHTITTVGILYRTQDYYNMSIMNAPVTIKIKDTTGNIKVQETKLSSCCGYYLCLYGSCPWIQRNGFTFEEDVCDWPAGHYSVELSTSLGGNAPVIYTNPAVLDFDITEEDIEGFDCGPKCTGTDADSDLYSTSTDDAGLKCCGTNGMQVCSDGVDCNDTSANAYPGAVETCDGMDNDCDSQVDESLPDKVTDVYGFDSIGQCKPQIEQCINGAYTITQQAVGPSPETCNDIDDSCNGIVDEVDDDKDGVNDCKFDRCLGTRPDSMLLTLNHYADIDLDGFFETVENVKGTKQTTHSGYTLLDTTGCSCAQVLDLKPGADEGELKDGCTKGTMDNFIKNRGWYSATGAVSASGSGALDGFFGFACNLFGLFC